MITALIVTQSNVGGSLKAALDRFIGSVFGAVYGSAVAFAIPHEHGLSRAAALIVAVAPLSFMAALSAGFRVAPITAIIVLLSVTGSTLGPFGFAVDRVLEVGLGCAVGLLVSVLIVPARASRLVLKAAAQVMRLLAEQLEALPLLGDPARSTSAHWPWKPVRASRSWRPWSARRRANGGAAFRMRPIPTRCFEP